MLTEKIIKYLKSSSDNFIEFIPEYQRTLKKYALENGFSHNDFVDFMSKYDSEIHGCEGFIINSLDDLVDYENSITKHLIENYGISEKYISLFNLEIDDYLLYNKEDDSVKLIEAQNMKELSNDEYYDEKWDSFNDFLEHFFELNK